MIKDLIIKKLEFIPDQWGYVIELLRDDWKEFTKFGQAYITGIYPGEKRPIAGWHYHIRQTDYVICLKGMVKAVFYDRREDSPSFKKIEEHVTGELNPQLITIPPNIVHAFQALGSDTAMMLNLPSESFNWKDPDEFKIPFDSSEIPYQWSDN